MIVTILEGEKNKSGKLFQQADLGFLKTDMETVGGQRIFEIVKSRYGSNGKYILESDIRDFVQDYERKEKERKGDRSAKKQSHGDFKEIFQQ
jgi:hypothetical protein